MPGMNGLQCLREISRLHPELPVIILTTFDEEPYIIDGLANGARSYLIKSADFQGLTTHIRDVFANKFVLPANIAAKLAHYLHEKKSNDQKSIAPLLFEQYSFTPMEKNIIHLLAERRTNKEIADRLFISVGTVKNHLISIFEKLEVKTRFEAFTFIENYSTGMAK